MSYINREPLLTIAKELQGTLFGAPLIARAIEQAPSEDFLIAQELIAKLKQKIKDTAFNPNNKFDFIYDEIYSVLDETLEEYLNEKST